MQSYSNANTNKAIHTTNSLVELNLIVLRKTHYQESSIIVAGLTPTLGRVDVIVRGAKNLSSKKFPSVDLFREICVEISTNKKNLHSVYSAELITNNDNITMYHSNYLLACDISTFILRNSQPELPTPLLFNGLKNILSILNNGKVPAYYLSLIKLIFLHENGLLPQLDLPNSEDYSLNNINSSSALIDSYNSQTLFLHKLLNHALGDGELPKVDDSYWVELDKWIELCLAHGAWN